MVTRGGWEAEGWAGGNMCWSFFAVFLPCLMTTDGKRQHTSSWFYMAMMKWSCPSTHKHTHMSAIIFAMVSLSLSLRLVLWWIPWFSWWRDTRASEEKGCCVILVRLWVGVRGLEAGEGVPGDSNIIHCLSCHTCCCCWWCFVVVRKKWHHAMDPLHIWWWRCLGRCVTQCYGPAVSFRGAKG